MRYLLVLLFAALTMGSARYETRGEIRERCPERMSIYELAELVTGAPAEIIEGIAFAESSKRDNVIGDDGESVGRYQWRLKYLDYHRAVLGPFDPRDPIESSIRAGQLLMRNYALLGSMDAAIAAHNQGPDGVRANGIDWEYVARVKGNK